MLKQFVKLFVLLTLLASILGHIYAQDMPESAYEDQYGRGFLAEEERRFTYQLYDLSRYQLAVMAIAVTVNDEDRPRTTIRTFDTDGELHFAGVTASAFFAEDRSTFTVTISMVEGPEMNDVIVRLAVGIWDTINERLIGYELPFELLVSNSGILLVAQDGHDPCCEPLPWECPPI